MKREINIWGATSMGKANRLKTLISTLVLVSASLGMVTEVHALNSIGINNGLPIVDIPNQRVDCTVCHANNVQTVATGRAGLLKFCGAAGYNSNTFVCNAATPSPSPSASPSPSPSASPSPSPSASPSPGPTAHPSASPSPTPCATVDDDGSSTSDCGSDDPQPSATPRATPSAKPRPTKRPRPTRTPRPRPSEDSRSGTVGVQTAGVAKTDVYQVTCPKGTTALSATVTDLTPTLAPSVSVQVTKGKAASPLTKDPVDGDKKSSAPTTLKKGAGSYLMKVNKAASTAKGAETYSTTSNCVGATSAPVVKLKQNQ